MPNINITTLDNGLRIITDTVPHVHSVALGTWIATGSRHETPETNGAAHMVEHMVFKGTGKRSAIEIVETIENTGGSINAYTSREITSYHAHVLKDDMDLALDVIADLVQGATLPDEEIERERDVILQEIKMVHDTPDDLVFDHYYETAFSGQIMGAPILGTVDTIKNMRKDSLQAHIGDYYTPENIVVSAAGNLDHEHFVEQVAQAFHALPQTGRNGTPEAARYEGGDFRLTKDLEQAHFVIGFDGLSRVDENYYAARALAILLGGGMSSRLFQEVREKRGLVYSIFAFTSAYTDSGLFGIYAGTGARNLTQVIPVICDELLNLSASVTPEEVQRARRQLKTNILMGRESYMMARADQQAKHILLHGSAFALDDVLARIKSINHEQIKELARTLFRSTPTIAAVGPVDKLESYDELQTRLAA